MWWQDEMGPTQAPPPLFQVNWQLWEKNKGLSGPCLYLPYFCVAHCMCLIWSSFAGCHLCGQLAKQTLSQDFKTGCLLLVLPDETCLLTFGNLLWLSLPGWATKPHVTTVFKPCFACFIWMNHENPGISCALVYPWKLSAHNAVKGTCLNLLQTHASSILLLHRACVPCLG